MEKEQKQFKFTSELSVEEIKKFPKCDVEITSRAKIDGDKIFYSNIIMNVWPTQRCKVVLRQDFNNNKIKPLLENEFIYLKMKTGKGDNVTRLRMKQPVRFITGIGSNGKRYHRIVVFLTNGIAKSLFLTEIDLNLMALDGLTRDDPIWEDAGVNEKIEIDEDDILSTY